MSRFTICSLTILLAIAPAALAVDGVVLINQSTMTNGLTGCPTGGHFPILICQSGSYRLSGNITVADAISTAIQVNANDVTIDLNGSSISGPGITGPQFTLGVGIYSFAQNTSVLNGTIRGMGSVGVNLVGGRVYRIQATGNGSEGILATGNSLVSECISSGNRGRGINVVGTALNNISIGNSLDGIIGSGLIAGNTVEGNSQNGINVEDALVSGNTVKFNHQFGIAVTCPGNIIGNLSGTSNRAGGITVAGTTCIIVSNATQ